MIGFEHFVGLIAEEFEVTIDGLSRETRLLDDLDFDSFQFFRLAVLVEMLLPGAELPVDVVLDALTVGNVYDYYAVEAAEREAGLR